MLFRSPLPERWRMELAHYNPRGTLAQGSLRWEGEATAPQRFAAKASFSDLGVARAILCLQCSQSSICNKSYAEVADCL